MRFDKFVEELQKAGWKDTNDAQHENIKKLWIKLFPVIAELENEIEDEEEYNKTLVKEIQKLRNLM